MSNVLVVGSSNVDLIARVSRFPDPGETVGDAVYKKVFGGKGANQAMAAVRAGGNVTFVTGIGNDNYALELKEHFQSNGIRTDHLKQFSDCPTGVALIMVDKSGENMIAVAPGANGKLTTDLVDERLIEWADIVLMQMEIPYRTVKDLALLTSKYNTHLMLNPAPARVLDEELLGCVDSLVLNESEANLVSGLSIIDDGIGAVAKKLSDMGSRMVIITLGKEGSFIYSEKIREKVPAFPVRAVDSTAAGDTFCGVLSVGISGGIEIQEAVRFASAAAAISVTRLGAQDSIPMRREIESFLDEHNRTVKQ
ncbi:MAG: ribokinase [Bacteroidales bacterium]|nr:ribokinase [Bacteroidales bacterium]MBN2699085.1 ribokinase [Bacteroidales bacterium]